MVAPGSNRGKPHSRGRGGGHQATGLLTAGGRHAPLEASICIVCATADWFPAGLPGRKNRKTANSGRTINLEVTPVEGENPPQPLSLGNTYQRGVRQIHRQITVFAHQVLSSGRHHQSLAAISRRRRPESSPRDHEKFKRYRASVKTGQTVPRGSLKVKNVSLQMRC